MKSTSAARLAQLSLLAAAGLASFQAQAATTVVNGSGSTSSAAVATDNSGGQSGPGAAVVRSATITGASKFNSSAGVLTGVAATLDTSGSLTRSAAIGTANVSASSWTLEGVSTSGAVASTPTSTTTFTQLATSSGFTLNNFVGGGNVASSVNYSVTATKTSTGFGDAVATLSTDATANLAITYTYLTHASLGGNNLNLGVVGGNTGASGSFLLGNVGQYGADFTITELTDTSNLYSIASGTGSVGGGASGSSPLVTFAGAASSGVYSAVYHVVWGDSLSQAGASGSKLAGQSFDVTVTTTVSAVPEPETYAMMLAGLGALGFVARRRKERQ